MEPTLLASSNICFYSANKYCILHRPISSFAQASFSFILSLAAHLNLSHPSLAPPTHPNKLPLSSSTPEHYIQQYLSYSPFYELWCDYLYSLVVAKRVLVVGEQVCLFAEVSLCFLESLKEKEHFLFKQQPNLTSQTPSTRIQIIVDLFYSQKQISHQNVPSSKKIAIANLSTSALNTDQSKPKMHLDGLLSGIFFNEGDQWQSFKILKKEIPSVEELEALNIIILTGSSHSINTHVPEIQKFLQNLKKAVEKNSYLKVLGLCFGHQALSYMNGSSISSKSLIAQVTNVVFDSSSLKKIPFLSDQQLSSDVEIEVCEYHSDHVVEIPENCSLIGSSESCSIEALISNDFRMLSFQFHPEYTSQFIKAYEMRAMNYGLEHFKPNYQRVLEQTDFNKHVESNSFMRKFIRRFINWQP